MCRGDPGKGVKTRPQLENSRVDFSSGMENVLPCHAKLMEMARAKMQFASEFARRLAAVRSPVEFSVSLQNSQTSGFACSKSKEMAEFSVPR
jgi:hypothetical protein